MDTVVVVICCIIAFILFIIASIIVSALFWATMSFFYGWIRYGFKEGCRHFVKRFKGDTLITTFQLFRESFRKEDEESRKTS